MPVFGSLILFMSLTATYHQNVSIVETATNEVVGEPLRTWDNWPDHLSGPPRDDSASNTFVLGDP